jgi:diaminohydroxyphosphoribosylaminopyrimidine deaminase / 5-amino-6-(5-phosphoribosylamino)uracil reductase
LPVSEFDRQQLRAALNLARGSFGLTEPNPRVGCVIGHADGRICGLGATQAAGSHHAEVMALHDAAAAAGDTRGATAWVSLEPCAHFGRTPPCCDALVTAGISRCVVAVLDPNPQVAGQGLARMRAAGIEVDVLALDDETAQEAREINLGFFSRIERGRPWVRAKMAASADGRTALPGGQSKWITGEAARADGHRWRKRASAVLTGIGTVLADNPRLDVRAIPTPSQPLRIVLDSRLRLPPDAALLAPPGAALVVAAPGSSAAAEALRRAGAEVWDDWPGGAMPNLQVLLARLAARGINEIHLEAGPTLTGAFHASGLIDEWLIYMAPTLLGPGRAMIDTAALPSLALARRGRWAGAAMVGDDLRLRLWA